MRGRCLLFGLARGRFHLQLRLAIVEGSVGSARTLAGRADWVRRVTVMEVIDEVGPGCPVSVTLLLLFVWQSLL